MADPRPLRDVFADLVGNPDPAGDPGALLSDQGHPGLPDDLVAEAVVSYADTAPMEVAEHLAPYVAAHSVVGADPDAEAPGEWPGLLGTAPDVTDLPEEDAVEAEPGLDFGTGSQAFETGTIEDDTVTEQADGIDEGLVADPVEPYAEADDWTLVEEAVPGTGDDAGDDDPDDLPV